MTTSNIKLSNYDVDRTLRCAGVTAVMVDSIELASGELLRCNEPISDTVETLMRGLIETARKSSIDQAKTHYGDYTLETLRAVECGEIVCVAIPKGHPGVKSLARSMRGSAKMKQPPRTGARERLAADVAEALGAGNEPSGTAAPELTDDRACFPRAC